MDRKESNIYIYILSWLAQDQKEKRKILHALSYMQVLVLNI